jgi:chromosomal replication initiation ATPase DnaA
MQTVRDCIKESIRHTLKSVNESVLLEEKLYTQFIKKENLTKKELDRLIDPGIYKIRKQEKVFADIPEPSQEETLILITISAECKVEIGEILSKSRKDEVVDARRIYIVILYIYLNYKLVQTGLRVNRDHSTVIHSISTHDNLIRTSNKYLGLFRRVLTSLYEVMPEILNNIRDNTMFEFNKKLNQEKWARLMDYQQSRAKEKAEEYLKNYGKDE